MLLFLLIAAALVFAFTLKADALIKFGGGVSAMSGSIGGTTFARSRAGAYARKWTKPVNPRSALQSACRANASYLATYWSKTLTEQERIDWRAYAAGTAWTNKLGESIEIGGNAAFMRLNALFRFSTAPPHAAAPTAMGHAGGVTLAFTADSALAKIHLADPGGAFDKDTGNNNLLIFQGLPSEAGRLATPKGFKYISWVQGSVGDPPAFPLEIPSAYTMTNGQLITIKAMFLDEHFRVSGPTWATVLAADV